MTDESALTRPPRKGLRRVRRAFAPLASAIALCAFPLGAGGTNLWISPYQVEFAVEARGMTIGTARWALRSDGPGRFVYRAEQAASGVAALFLDEKVEEQTVVEVDGDGFRPVSYRYDRRGRREKHVSLTFDETRGVAHGTYKDRTVELPVPAGVQDKLSYFLMLMSDVRAGKQDMTYQVADGDQLKTYRFVVTGRERIDSAVGSFDTIVVQRLHEKPKRRTTLWCAPDLRYLPIKVVHHDKDGVVRLAISATEGLGISN